MSSKVLDNELEVNHTVQSTVIFSRDVEKQTMKQDVMVVSSLHDNEECVCV